MNVPMPSKNAITGIDRALSKFEERVREAIEMGANPNSKAVLDLMECLQAAQGWMMVLQGDIRRAEVVNESR